MKLFFLNISKLKYCLKELRGISPCNLYASLFRRKDNTVHLQARSYRGEWGGLPCRFVSSSFCAWLFIKEPWFQVNCPALKNWLRPDLDCHCHWEKKVGNWTFSSHKILFLKVKSTGKLKFWRMNLRRESIPKSNRHI